MLKKLKKLKIMLKILNKVNKLNKLLKPRNKLNLQKNKNKKQFRKIYLNIILQDLKFKNH